MHIGIANYPQLSLLSAYLLMEPEGFAKQKHSQQSYSLSLNLSLYLFVVS